MNRIIQFAIGKIKGFYPICDRCLNYNRESKLSFIDYLKHSKNNCVYCDRCWNFIHIRRGKCECGTGLSQRDEYGLDIKSCPNCYSLVKMYV